MQTDSVPTHQPPQKVLAIDTSTDRLSVAVGAAGADVPLAVYEGAGGAQASATLIPTVQRLLAEVGWPMAALDAIAFGCGPGSFTGLRTACAVVQGLAVAARPGGIPVLPVNTLLAVAEEARWQQVAQGASQPDRIIAVLDARMDEMYVADVHRDAQQGLVLHGQPWLSAPEDLPIELVSPLNGGGVMLAGNAMPVYGARLPDAWAAVPQVAAWPTAAAILRLAGALWAKGGAVTAAEAQPVYVRDKVAQTTEERERIKAAKALAEGQQA